MASVYECSDLCGFISATAPLVERCNACGTTSALFGEFCPVCGRQDFSAVCPECGVDAVCDHPDTDRSTLTQGASDGS